MEAVRANVAASGLACVRHGTKRDYPFNCQRATEMTSDKGCVSARSPSNPIGTALVHVFHVKHHIIRGGHFP